jgi:uncharacterized membrane protein
MLQYLGIIIAATVGFVLSIYIWRKKKQGEKLFCLIGDDCNRVVNSRYATTLGASNEIIGILYYAGIAIAFSLGLSGLVSFSFWWLTPITGVAALFSVYLVSVQLFILKEWCEWCLVSAITSIIIFILILL